MNSIEIAKKFKEEKKKELSDRKVQVKIEKGKVLNNERTEKLIKKQKSKVSSLKNVSNKVKKVTRGISIGSRKKKTKTRSQLVKELDTIFSRYIRMRDADKNGICTCITCGDKKPRKEMHNTHFISRSNYRYRRSVMNCWAGCYKCNVILHGNYIAYTIKMIEMFGQDKIKEMKEDKELIKVSTPEIRENIDLYSHYVDLMIKEKFTDI